MTATKRPNVLERARDIGYEHGRDAASWFVQESIGGRARAGTERTTAQRILAGLEEGDPEVLDALPGPDLSGQWADGYTPDLLADDLGCGDEWRSGYIDLEDAFMSYEDGFMFGVQSYVEESCRKVLAEER